MPVDINPMFAVPLGMAHHPQPQALNGELRDLFIRREQEGTRFRNPNPSLEQQPGVFESHFELFSWPEPCVQALRQFCWTALGEMLAGANGYDAREMSAIRIYSHTWYHITRKGGFVIPHTHPMASWSGVYCVDTGGDAPGHPDSGILRFHNPHFYSNTFLDAGNARLKPPYHHGFWNQRLEPGRLVLFPSWLPHDVTPFHGEGTRITVAFNCWFGQA